MRIVLARLAEHFGRTVQAQNLRSATGYFSGQLSSAATEIQNTFVWPRCKQLQQAATKLPDIGVATFVSLSVPAHAFLLRAFPFLGFSDGSDSTSDSASGSASGSASASPLGSTSSSTSIATSSTTAPGTAASSSCLNSSCFLRS